MFKSTVIAAMCALFCLALTGCPVALLPLPDLLSAPVISPPDDVAGTIKPGEVEYFSFLANTTQAYYIYTFSNTRLLLSVIDSDRETLLTFSSDFKDQPKAEVIFEPPADGRYFISVQTADITDSEHRYVLSLLALEPDDHANYPQDGTLIPLDGTPVEGQISSQAIFEDYDWFVLQTEFGGFGFIEVSSEGNLDIDTFDNSLYYLDYAYAPAGETIRIPVADGYGTAAYLSAYAYDGSSVDYSLSFVSPPSSRYDELSDAGGLPGSATPLPADLTWAFCTFNSYGDVDVFSFPATAGQTYTIQTLGYADTLITVLGPDGVSLVGGNDDGGIVWNALLTFTATETGNYFIEIQEYYGSTGQYVLLIEPL